MLRKCKNHFMSKIVFPSQTHIRSEENGKKTKLKKKYDRNRKQGKIPKDDNTSVNRGKLASLMTAKNVHQTTI